MTINAILKEKKKIYSINGLNPLEVIMEHPTEGY